MTSPAVILTLGESAMNAWFAGVSLVVGVLALVVTVLKHLDTKAERRRAARDAERQKRDDERHGQLCESVEKVHERVSQTKQAVEAFRGEVALEIASLHRADAEMRLDLERRVAPIEGKLGIGRRDEKAGAD